MILRAQNTWTILGLVASTIGRAHVITWRERAGHFLSEAMLTFKHISFYNILLSRGHSILSYIYVSIKTREGGWDLPSMLVHCTF